MSASKRSKASRDRAALKVLNIAIDELAEVTSADRLQPALDGVATALRQVFPLPPKVRDGGLDEILAFLETKGLGAGVTELATFNELVEMVSSEDYDDPPIDSAALRKLVKGLKKGAEKLEAQE